jgi:RNA polymerase primary sigma factor
MRQLKIVKQITNRDSISLEKYLNEVSPIQGITAEEEVELSKLIQEKDEVALHKMIRSNLRFVISVAKQYQNRGLSLSDLISAGNEGLIIAAKRFDHSRGFKFISYAVWWIRQSILRYINEEGRQIKMPLNKVNDLNKVRNAFSALEQRYERTPTPEEIAVYLSEKFDKKNFTMEYVENLMAASSNPTSLDMPIGDDSNSSLIDLIKSESSVNVESDLISSDLKSVIDKLLTSRLTTKEKEIVVSFYGLNGVVPKSLEEIGIKLDLTRERVRQIKEKAIRKLRFNSKINEMKDYL